jgi:hypothetical protein
MRRVLTLALVFALGLTAAPAAAGPSVSSSAKKALKCKRGYVKKRVRGKFKCVKRKKTPSKTKATPGLDVLATPGTYKGSNGATVTTRKESEFSKFVSITVVVNKGYSFCKRGQSAVTVSVPDMQISSSGHFSGVKPTPGGQAQITGDFTAGNSLKIEITATGIKTGGQTCGAQVHGLTILL